MEVSSIGSPINTFVPGLAAVDAATTTTSRGHEADFAEAGRGLDGGETPGGRREESAHIPRDSAELRASAAPAREALRTGASDAPTAYAAEAEGAA